jgi:hypothetical protein
MSLYYCIAAAGSKIVLLQSYYLELWITVLVIFYGKHYLFIYLIVFESKVTGEYDMTEGADMKNLWSPNELEISVKRERQLRGRICPCFWQTKIQRKIRA